MVLLSHTTPLIVSATFKTSSLSEFSNGEHCVHYITEHFVHDWVYPSQPIQSAGSSYRKIKTVEQKGNILCMHVPVIRNVTSYITVSLLAPIWCNDTHKYFVSSIKLSTELCKINAGINQSIKYPWKQGTCNAILSLFKQLA